MNDIEKRKCERIETRKTEDGKRAYIDGVIPYNSMSGDLGGFQEIIAPSAFTRTINAGTDVKMYWNHNDSEVLGSTRAGTLTLDNRADGLHFSVLVPEHAMNRYETISRGDVNQVSFGFSVEKGGDKWDERTTPPTRTLTAARLWEISPTPNPAYESTSAEVAFRSRGTGEEKPATVEATPEQAADEQERSEIEALKFSQESALALVKARFGL